MSSQQYQLSVNMENIGLLILAVAELASFHSLWKATKKQIEYYELPTLFITFAYISDLTRFFLGAVKVEIPYVCVLTLFIEIIFIIWTIVILIRDNTRKGICTILLFVIGSIAFIVLSLILFILYYVYIFVAMLGPLECLSFSLKKKKKEILPIITAILLFICNVFYLIGYLVEQNHWSFTAICGILATLAEIIVYLVIRSKQGEGEGDATTSGTVEDPNKPLVYNKM